MPKYRRNAARIFSPAVQDALISYVVETGNVKAALAKLPVKISAEWVSKQRKANPALDQRLNLAVAAHNAGSPDQNIRALKGVEDLLMYAILTGETETIQKIDPKSKEVLELTVKQRKRFDPRLWEIVHPKKPITEQSILFVTANQTQAAIADPALTEERRAFLLQWLSGWTLKAAEELQKQGVNLKYLDAEPV
jgi:hypothetical protein